MLEESLTYIIQKMCAKQIRLQISVGKATNINVSERTCDIVLNDDLTLFNCRLNAVIDSYDDSLLILPKDYSTVAFIRLEGKDTSCIVIAYTEIDRLLIHIGDTHVDISSDSLTLNEGSLGGLINIEALTNKLNQLIASFNSHSHQVSTTGSATAQTGVASPVASPLPDFNKADYEDTKIKH